MEQSCFNLRITHSLSFRGCPGNLQLLIVDPHGVPTRLRPGSLIGRRKVDFLQILHIPILALSVVVHSKSVWFLLGYVAALARVFRLNIPIF